MKEALFYKKLKNKIVQCQLCPHFCALKEDEIGKCKARKNINCKLISLSYGKPVAIHIDPITKKPIYRYMQGTETFSIGTAGCTLKCSFCQNAEIAHASPEQFKTEFREPIEIIRLAKEYNCPSISYTYSEPVTMYEYMLDIAKLAKKHKIKNIMVSNGYINQEPLKELCKYLDAANIDLKAFREEFYKTTCKAKLEPVLETLKTLKKQKIHLEITNLIIPTLNDNLKDIEKMCIWIKNNLGKDTPLHFSRFFPMYQLKHIPETPLQTLEKAKIIADKHLNYVYLGNV